MRILRAGYLVEQQLRQDRANGVEPAHREGLSRFAQQLENDTWTDEMERN